MAFIYEQDLPQLQGKKLMIDTDVPPQYSAEEAAELNEFAETVKVTMVRATVGLLILKIFLHLGLQYVWNLLNILIFLIFMQMWLITLPVKARIFLKELKNLVLLEFIPYDELFGFLEEDSDPYET